MTPVNLKWRGLTRGDLRWRPHGDHITKINEGLSGGPSPRAKAANLMKINKTARIAEGFVITSHAMRRIDDEQVQVAVLNKLASLKCDRVVVRSSHASEDSSTGSYAGLFESYVNVDAGDPCKVIELAKSVYASQRTDSVNRYGERKETCL
ncbi:hypothetical protein GCM10027614_41360 [Micromonospora vulcania]